MSADKSFSGRQALSDAEIERLAAFLSGLKNPDALDLEAMDGFFLRIDRRP